MTRLREFHLTLEYRGYSVLFYCHCNLSTFDFSHTITDPNGHVLMTRAPFTYLLDALRDAIKVVDTYTEL